MNISYVTTSHPSLNNRKLTLLFIDNKIDIYSSKFLINQSRNGGRNNSILGRSSHKNLAIKIGELYRHLDSMNLKWNNATESDIISIRNAMLCWDRNNNENIWM